MITCHECCVHTCMSFKNTYAYIHDILHATCRTCNFFNFFFKKTFKLWTFFSILFCHGVEQTWQNRFATNSNERESLGDFNRPIGDGLWSLNGFE